MYLHAARQCGPREASVVSLAQLRTFQAVVEHRSMTRAARALGIAVSSVSTQVRALTDDLGFTLLRRTDDGGYDATDAGRAVLKSCVIVLREIERMESAGTAQAARTTRSRRTPTNTRHITAA
jgi:DNA-binding transcriptional LysR family regulator